MERRSRRTVTPSTAPFSIAHTQHFSPSFHCCTHSVATILEKMDAWDFDIFALQEATNGHGLVVGGIHLMTSMGVLDKIPIPRDKLATYLMAIEDGYVTANPFHNEVHAADVMFTTNYFLNSPLLRDMTGALDKFAAVLAAAVHDYAHPASPTLTYKRRATIRPSCTTIRVYWRCSTSPTPSGSCLTPQDATLRRE